MEDVGIDSTVYGCVVDNGKPKKGVASARVAVPVLLSKNAVANPCASGMMVIMMVSFWKMWRQ